MSRQPSLEKSAAISDSNELDVIKAENTAPASSTNVTEPEVEINKIDKMIMNCPCKTNLNEAKEVHDKEDIERAVKEREEELKEEFKIKMEKEIHLLKERFNFILHNEQVRSLNMLREAHRERSEKVTALQNQLECKNLAGLMYVLCSERRKNKLEIMKMREEYTSYIHALQDILAESESLILNLSRGYKTAARVDHEWREKMKKVVTEFQNFIHHFAGGAAYANQYFFDLPALMKTHSSLQDNPQEDPCETEASDDVDLDAPPEEKTWWDTLEGDSRPFIVFGDMADFTPPQRREVLKAVKAAKTAPKKWKEYAFNNMLLNSSCANMNAFKEEYLSRLLKDTIECPEHHGLQALASDTSRRITRPSLDIRGNMGSILKVITSGPPQPVTKATLLGARDSMEIASTTKVREKHKQSGEHRVVLNIGDRIGTLLNEMDTSVEETEATEEIEPSKETTSKMVDENEGDESLRSTLGSIHNDSLQVISSHVPDLDHRINYEKVCPMEQCQRLHTDSFMRSLPAYMRASPFMHFEQTYDEYEPCSPEQLEILKHRIEEKKRKEKIEFIAPQEDPLEEWKSSEGVAVQTSELSLSIPPCTCMAPSPTPASSSNMFDLADFIPVKLKLNTINQECLYDNHIEFNRFQVIGEEDADFVPTKEDSTKTRLHAIQKILKHHPSLCDIFQGNQRC